MTFSNKKLVPRQNLAYFKATENIQIKVAKPFQITFLISIAL